MAVEGSVVLVAFRLVDVMRLPTRCGSAGGWFRCSKNHFELCFDQEVVGVESNERLAVDTSEPSFTSLFCDKVVELSVGVGCERSMVKRCARRSVGDLL